MNEPHYQRCSGTGRQASTIPRTAQRKKARTDAAGGKSSQLAPYGAFPEIAGEITDAARAVLRHSPNQEKSRARRVPDQW